MKFSDFLTVSWTVVVNSFSNKHYSLPFKCIS